MKFLAHLICFCIYPFSFLLPRRKKRWAFGSFRGAFNDNAKYLFIHVSEKMTEIDSAWLSMNKSTVQEIRTKGLVAFHVLSPKGIWYALTSKYWFFNAYSSDIMFCLSGGAKLVNLWHGLPMKRIEFDIISGPLADRYVKRSLKERFYHPENFQRPDYLLAASSFFSETFARSFRIPLEQCLLIGYPRNVILNCSEAERMNFVKKYEPDTTKTLISKLKEGGYDRVFIYLPTWRDSQRDFFSHDFDLKALDETLRQCNALLLLKPHANVALEPSVVEGLTNVEFVPSSVDIYPVLPYTDVLITDYSSVLYDYVLMEHKGMILYLYDFQEYEKERNFTRAFDDLAFGKRVFDFVSLLTTIGEGDYMMKEDDRKAFACKCWGLDSKKASERLGLFFQQA